MSFARVFFENNIENCKKMYRGFNLKLDKDIFSDKEINYYSRIAETKISDSMKNFPHLYISIFKDKNILDAKQIMNKFFPQYNRFDIFLSHSHNDLNLALTIAGILKKEFHLNVFVDSIVWKNCTDLLRSIDNEYCRIKKGSYDYNKRNYSTSHVYLILMNSLNMMIDECETLFFLNTPNSISLEDNLDNLDDLDRTLSPWIFSEIQTSKIIRKKIPNRNIPLMESTKYFSTDLKISYLLELDHLTEMSQDNFLKWIYSDYDNPNEALDGLYEIYPLEKHININRF